MSAFAFYGSSAINKLISVSNLGSLGLTYMNSAFRGCGELSTVVAGDSDLSDVTDMRYLCYTNPKQTLLDFRNVDASSCTQISTLVSGTTLMENSSGAKLCTLTTTKIDSVFSNCGADEQDISGWVTTNVTTAANCFEV